MTETNIVLTEHINLKLRGAFRPALVGRARARDDLAVIR
jgi:hypothetical protein